MLRYVGHSELIHGQLTGRVSILQHLLHVNVQFLTFFYTKTRGIRDLFARQTFVRGD